MLKLKINNQPVNFPTSWNEVSYSQYLKILESKSKAELICILLNQDYELVKNKIVTNLEALFEAASFSDEVPAFEIYYPQVGTYKLPANNQHTKQFDIRFESLGQFEDMRQVMKDIKQDDPASLFRAYGKAVAIYLQKLRDKEYDPAKVPELEEELQSFKACEVIAVGQFFFLKLISLTSGTVKTSPPTVQSQKKSPPVSKSSRKPLGRTRR